MAELLRQGLSDLDCVCQIAANGTEGLKVAAEFDLLVVDVMMPLMNGFVMVEKLRERGLRMPIIYVTAKDATKDVVRGFEVGADDYLVKPFKFEELVARVKSALRRARDLSQVLTWLDLTLDCVKRSARRGETELFLSATEHTLLETFMRRPGEVLSKSTLLREVWHDEGYRDENIVETYVTYLRRKTESRNASRIIQTVRGKGYVLALVETES